MDRQPARSSEDLIVWLAHDLEYGSNAALSEDAAEVGRLLGSYARALLTPSS